MNTFFESFSDGKKRMIVFFHDALVAALIWPLSLAIRLGEIQFDITPLRQSIFICFFCKIIAFLAFRLYRGVWKFSSTKDLIAIIKAAGLATVLSMMTMFFWNRLSTAPRSAFIIDWFLTCFFLGGSRLAYRIWKDKNNFGNRTDPTLIIGTNETSEQLIRDILRDSTSQIKPVGLLSQTSGRVKRTIHGISILGGLDDIEKMVEKHGITHAIIALPEQQGKNLKSIISRCLDLNIKTQTLPSMKDLVDGKVQVSQLRPINVEDLLGRDVIHLNEESLSTMVRAKTILVTGAGGSIGSELCKQICKYSPRALIIVDSCEFFLYKIDITLKELFPDIQFFPIIADIRDRPRMAEVFGKFMPDNVFHAAAYKHVPIMEINPFEAIKTNVMGTHNLSSLAAQFNVSRFIMISTDKAVNPTNIMGASKRLAEMTCLYEFNKQKDLPSKTKFSMVRFGNVLASAGSVIPRFLEQIKSAGPITVTHPEITRYFMSIPEASQLVLQASSLGQGGEIFLLEMGEPVKIVDLAKNLIKLSGLSEEDIEIKFTGLRPGEKLYEELLTDEEHTLPTSHELVRAAKARELAPNFKEQIDKIIQSTNREELISNIRILIPEYKPDVRYNTISNDSTLM